jgi:hypothetical protein
VSGRLDQGLDSQRCRSRGRKGAWDTTAAKEHGVLGLFIMG